MVENASDILAEYLLAHGGEDKILEESEKGVKGKKRGRPAASAPAAGKRRKGDHPSDSTPPATTKAWKPPAGSWEDEVQSIDACHDENSGKLIVYLTWKNGQKTQHETKVIYQRCPQKVRNILLPYVGSRPNSLRWSIVTDPEFCRCWPFMSVTSRLCSEQQLLPGCQIGMRSVAADALILKHS